MNQDEPIRMTARFVAFLYSADIIWPSSLRWTKKHALAAIGGYAPEN